MSEIVSGFARALTALGEAGVEFVVVGVGGINFYARTPGDAFATLDVDALLAPAIENLELALEIAGRLDLPDLSADAMIALGRIDGIIGDVEQGRQHMRQAVGFAADHGLADHQVSALLALGAALPSAPAR